MNTQFQKDIKQLINYQSTTDNKGELEKCLEFCKSLLPKNTRYVAKIIESNGVSSLLVTYDGIKNPDVFLNGHIDVVPARSQHFTPIIREDRIIGRGVYDMKVSVLTYLYLLKTLPEKIQPKVGLMIVSDEETGGYNGTKIISEMGYKPKIFITGEPSDLDIYTEAKGVLWIEVKQKGRSSHSGLPWEGDNAIVNLNHAINRLLSLHPIPKEREWITTYNISKIEGGVNINSVPDECRLFLDIRYVPTDSPSHIIKSLQSIFPDSELKVILKESPITNDESNHYIQKLAKTITKVTGNKPKFEKNDGSTDARYYSRLNIPAVSFGPLGGNAHSDDEWVDIKSIKTYSNTLLEFLVNV